MLELMKDIAVTVDGCDILTLVQPDKNFNVSKDFKQQVGKKVL